MTVTSQQQAAGSPAAGRGGGRRGAGSAALGAATYLALFCFGVGQALVGAFFYAAGPAPLAALCFDAAIFTTGVLGAWGTRSPLGALAPAVGWLLASFALASGSSHQGSVLIEASAAGEWFLFGGAVAAMAGLIVGVVAWSRPRRSLIGPGRFG